MAHAPLPSVMGVTVAANVSAIGGQASAIRTEVIPTNAEAGQGTAGVGGGSLWARPERLSVPPLLFCAFLGAVVESPS